MTFYLSMEACQARLFALLDRIEREARENGILHTPDFYRLPISLRQEILRRMLCSG